MKTITYLLSVMLLFGSHQSMAQSAFNDEEITAETFVQMIDNDHPGFAISPLRVENAANGFRVKWQTMNDNVIASFEVQISEDRKNFTTIKKIQRSGSQEPVKIYAAEFNNTIVLSEKVYFRVKSILANGAANFTDPVTVKIRQAK